MTRTEKIKAEIELAKQHDEKAREHRKRAGQLLRGHTGSLQSVAHAVGVDVRLLDLLAGM